jgi:hypothetical protein
MVQGQFERHGQLCGWKSCNPTNKKTVTLLKEIPIFQKIERIFPHAKFCLFVASIPVLNKLIFPVNTSCTVQSKIP